MAIADTIDKGLLFSAVLIGGFLVATNAGGFATVIQNLAKGGIAGAGTLQGRSVKYGDVQVGGLANTPGPGGGTVGIGNPFAGVGAGGIGSIYTPPTFFY